MIHNMAMTYAINNEKYLRYYIEDGRVEISNNSAERCCKSFVILVSMYSIYSYGFRPFIFALSIMLYAAPLALAPLMLFENRKFFLPMTKLLQHLSAELLLSLTRPSSI